MQSEMLKNAEITANSKQISRLKDLFPNAFDKNGRFMPHKLEDIVKANEVDVTCEGYKLDWLGKSYARLLANLKTETLLTENIEHNAKPENVNSENMLIQGDNLDVLKHLVNAYSEKVKMIYIDPPYNTGSDGFVYSDNRTFTPEELAKLAGIDNDEALRILDFTQSKSNSHSAWLTFMYPRLYIARELLRDDGVIFISIDDNEQAQLRLLCDEVFGEENFISNLVWEKKRKGTFLSDTIASVKEYVLVYSKEKAKFGGLIGQINRETTTYPCINDSNKRVVRKIPKGIVSKFKEENYKLSSGEKISAGNMNLILKSDLVIENSVLSEDLMIEGNWRYTQKNIDNFAAQSELYITQDLYVRRIVSEPRFKVLKDLLPRVGSDEVEESDDPNNIISDENLFSSGWGSNEEGEEALRLLLGHKGLMSFPKPVRLISKLVSSLRDKDDIVLDFFAGSGTTAHAVMQLNAEDGGNRKYICIQIDEVTEEGKEAQKAGYNTIFDITRERIIRAAKKIQKDHPQAQCDFGFKEFKTIPANEGQFVGYLDDADTMEDYVPFNGMVLDEEARHALLTTWKVYDGLPLTQALQEVDLGGYVAYGGGDRLYFINPRLALKHIIKMLEYLDDDDNFTSRKLVAFHYMFDDKMLREFSEAVNAPNRKHLKLDFIQRF